MTTFKTWQDLCDEQAPASAVESPTVPPLDTASAEPPGTTRKAAAPEGIRAALPAGVELPPDVAALLAEYEAAEANLRRLTGQAPSEPEDARESARFPLRVHSAASRLEERRIADQDQRASAARKRRQEERLIEQRRAAERQAAISAARDAARQEAVQARIRAEIEAQHAAERARRAVLEVQQRQRWERNRRRALADAAAARRELATHEQHRLDEVRARGLERLRTARLEQAADERRWDRVRSRREEAFDG